MLIDGLLLVIIDKLFIMIVELLIVELLMIVELMIVELVMIVLVMIEDVLPPITCMIGRAGWRRIRGWSGRSRRRMVWYSRCRKRMMIVYMLERCCYYN